MLLDELVYELLHDYGIRTVKFLATIYPYPQMDGFIKCIYCSWFSDCIL